jgi:hypothetical protein
MSRPQDENPEPDAGAFIGNRPEAAAETIPGGVRDDDERVAAYDSQSSGTGKREDRVQGRDDEWPAGHREAETPDER